MSVIISDEVEIIDLKVRESKVVLQSGNALSFGAYSLPYCYCRLVRNASLALLLLFGEIATNI